MTGLAQDIRYALRGLRRTPGFTAVVLLTLALGIGANSAMFSIVNGVILRPLGYAKPEQLMFLSTQFPGLGFDEFWVSPPEYFEFRSINQSFASVGAFATGEVNLTAGDRPMRLRQAAVDEHLLAALGLQPLQGRLFAKGETDVTGAAAPGQPAPQPPRVVIVSHELWQSALGGRPTVGEMLEINGVNREVIGIMPPGADVMDNRTAVWMPIGLNPANRQNRGSHFLYLIGRLKDGVSPETARNELNALVQNWGERVGVKNHVFTPAGQDNAHFLQMQPVQAKMLGEAGSAIWVLQAAVGLVLLIACANLANLMLARAETKRREFAVRTALGAGRSRLLRQFMAESLVLAFTGAALGLVVAHLALQAVMRAFPESLPRIHEVSIDPSVLLFTAAVALATGVLFGLAPLVHTRVKGLTGALKEGASRGSTAGARHFVRRALVAGEVALAVMLVIGAGLLAQTVYNLVHVDAGFDRSRLVTFSMTIPGARYPQPGSRVQLFRRVLDRLRAVPGVAGATAMSGLPPDRPVNANDTDIDGYTAPPEGPSENVDYYQFVMSDYFETMGIPIVRGRGFQQGDAAAPGFVAVVNESLANRFWSGRDPVGQRLRPCCNQEIPWFTVVGVAKDVKQAGVDQQTGTEFYFFAEEAAAAPAGGAAPATMNVVLRTTLPASSLGQTVERVVAEADGSVPIVRFREMDAVFEESISRPRLLAQLLGGFALLGLVLAAVGTYGLLSYMVAERRREIGIRMALGATRSAVLGYVMKQGLLLTVIGAAIGLAAAFGLGRLIASLLFGVEPTDPATMIGVTTAMLLVATVACGFPAWRASRLAPGVVLRYE